MEEIQARLVPEIIVRIGGEPVRITVSLRGSVTATMAKKGYFPISSTGYRSVLAGGARVLKRKNRGTVPWRLRHDLEVDALSFPSELSALARELSSAGVA